MNDLGLLLSKIIEKFDIRKIMFSVFVVLALMLVPKINFLHFLMPLDNIEKWIKFIFAIITTYIIILVFVFGAEYLKNKIKYRPKIIRTLMGDLGKYVNIFYSEDIKKYSSRAVDLEYCGVPKDVINKLVENNIIEDEYYTSSKYCLTKNARKKLTRIKKIVVFVDNRMKTKEKEESENNYERN